MFPTKTLELAKRVVSELSTRNMMIVTAESCTGGLIAGALTAVPGSSLVVHGGFVTYANEAKMAMIDVPNSVLDQHGAVSEQVARLMAEGAVANSGTDIAIAVTGVAGPGGGTIEKPVGLVHIACLSEKITRSEVFHFGDIGRDAVRLATVDAALELVLEVLANQA